MVFVDHLAFSINLFEKRVPKSFTQKFTQTDPYTIFHRGNQSKRYKSNNVQTENCSIAEENICIEAKDSVKLHEFLSSVTSNMCSQLFQNSISRAWKNTPETDPQLETTYLPTLSYIQAKSSGHSVTCVSWNAVGSVIAAAYGQLNHNSWCTHSSYLVLWNINRSSLKTETPDYVFETNSCINCVSFHPQNSSLIACGTFSGEILIWTLANEFVNLVATSGGVDGGHQDAVNQLIWFIPDAFRNSREVLLSSSKHSFYFVSFGGDGRIICWTLDRSQEPAKLRPVKIYRLSGKDQLRANLQDDFVNAALFNCSSLSSSVNNDHPLGITTSDFSKHNPSNLLIGTDSGGLLCCEFQVSDWNLANVDASLSHKFPSPVKFVLARFSAPVHCVSWSPHHRNLVAACGVFQGIHIFNIIERIRLMTIDSTDGQVYSIQFALSNPFFLLAGFEKGKLAIFDMSGLTHGDNENELEDVCQTKIPIASVFQRFELPGSVKETHNPVISVAFNQHILQCIGVGDKNGSIHVLNMEGVNSNVSMLCKVTQLEKLVDQLSH